MFPQTVRQRDYIFDCLGACRDYSVATKVELVEILHFDMLPLW